MKSDKLIKKVKATYSWYTYQDTEGVLLREWDVYPFEYDVICFFAFSDLAEWVLELILDGQIDVFSTNFDARYRIKGEGAKIDQVEAQQVQDEYSKYSINVMEPFIGRWENVKNILLGSSYY
jgi:hypothetical protein